MEKTPKRKLKLYLSLFITTIIIVMGIYIYYKYKEFVKLQDLANSVIVENKEYIMKQDAYVQLKTKIENEKFRCEQLLLKEEGNFSEFSYCQKFIDFIDESSTN